MIVFRSREEFERYRDNKNISELDKCKDSPHYLYLMFYKIEGRKVEYNDKQAEIFLRLKELDEKGKLENLYKALYNFRDN